ncbi:uncharacterized protein V1516DRAFT_664388 [Lipomyces oligophaga]|uniref:uncharacterized protein n=1 Tax=Lipomyces oligophaga TaxID=45792 RepID=UPI0034CE206C
MANTGRLSRASIPGYYYDEDKKKYFRILSAGAGGGSSSFITRDTVHNNESKKRKIVIPERFENKIMRSYIPDAFVRKLDSTIVRGRIALEIGTYYDTTRSSIAQYHGIVRGSILQLQVDQEREDWIENLGNIEYLETFNEGYPAKNMLVFSRNSGYGGITDTMYWKEANKGRRKLSGPMVELLSGHVPLTQVITAPNRVAYVKRPAINPGYSFDVHVSHRETKSKFSMMVPDYVQCGLFSGGNTEQSGTLILAGGLRVGTHEARDGYKACSVRRFSSDVFALTNTTPERNSYMSGHRNGRMVMYDSRIERKHDRLNGGGIEFGHHASAITQMRKVNEDYLLVSGLDSTLALYDMRFTGSQSHKGQISEPVLNLERGYVNRFRFDHAFAVSPDSRLLAIGGQDGRISVYNISTGRRLESQLTRQKYDQVVKCAAWTEALNSNKYSSEGLLVGNGLVVEYWTSYNQDLSEMDRRCGLNAES